MMSNSISTDESTAEISEKIGDHLLLLLSIEVISICRELGRATNSFFEYICLEFVVFLNVIQFVNTVLVYESHRLSCLSKCKIHNELRKELSFDIVLEESCGIDREMNPNRFVLSIF